MDGLTAEIRQKMAGVLHALLMTPVLSLMGLTISAPDHTTVSRRAVTLLVLQATSVPHSPLHVLA